ncbi:MAG: efflux RND transporter permease subunit [Proteobacteria bacterium]|nr:efflux RND transporter permease subunit [Pseudomonadota bacterium]
MKGIISWFADNHVAANLLMMFLILAGVVTGGNTKIEVFPEFSLDRISITAVYPGASPEEVEDAIIRKIEESVAGLAGIKRIDSTAKEGIAAIVIEVIKDWDVKELLDEVKSEVDRITTFPKEMEKAVVRELTRRSQVINVAVYGEAPESTIKFITEKIKDDITNLPGITLAELFGIRTGEIHVDISEKTLRKYNLTLGMVAEAIKKSSLDLPAGSVKTEEGEILVRTKGRKYDAGEYDTVPVITRPDGTRVTLGMIATINDGFEDVDLVTQFQGKPAAVIQVFRVADQNALDVVAATRAYIDEIRPSLPEGVDIGFFKDQSVVLKGRIKLLLTNMLYGLVLVSLILAVFLNIKLAFWVTLGIPISFLTGMWLLPQFDVSINMISLFAFIMVLGIVVDDAIIIGENVYKKMEQGLPTIEAAKKGAREMGMPVLFAVLTTIAAFYPLLMGTGNMGKVMRNIPIVVIVVLVGSLVESLFILPAHLARTRHVEKLTEKKTGRIPGMLQNFIGGPYKNAISFCVKWRYITMASAFLLLFLAIGTLKGGFLKFTFMPVVESDEIVCSLTMPSGTPFEHTTKIAWDLEKKAREVISEADKNRHNDAPSLFEHSVTFVGMHMAGRGPGAKGDDVSGNLAQITIQLLDGEQRDVSAALLASKWREKAGIIPGAESITFQSVLFSPGNPIEVHLSMEDHDQLVSAAAELKQELGNYPGVFDISDSFLSGKQEIQLNLKESAESLGLTLSDLALQVRNAFYGAEALRVQRGKDEVKVMVRYPASERKSVDNIEEMRIRTPGGAEVPFRDVAEVTVKQGYASIERAQRRRVIKVYADVDESMTNANDVRKNLSENSLVKLKENYPGLRYDMEGQGKEQEESMADVKNGFIISLFIIYALLAVPFKSFSQPFVVMSAIPFGIVGALLGHIIMGFNLSILSMFGIVGLTGVVVNDSLVLIHAINQLRDEGESIGNAVIRAGMMRFRAIILTSLTTFAGLFPMILEKSYQAKFLIPMAISLGFGVLFATGITLLIIPCGYVVLMDILMIKERFIHKLLFLAKSKG